jgi:hypothetical protein
MNSVATTPTVTPYTQNPKERLIGEHGRPESVRSDNGPSSLRAGCWLGRKTGTRKSNHTFSRYCCCGGLVA